MSDGVHLLVPFASSIDEGCVQALRNLALPRLEKLLARLAAGARESGDARTLSMPCERLMAREFGLPAQDGRIPWAAWEARAAGHDAGSRAWARITPCHWEVGTGHVDMHDPRQLKLEAAHSRELLAAMRPYFEADGIALEYEGPTRWLAHGEIFRELATASLDRVVGRAIDDWIPRAPQAAPLRRLQQEMQMLLYTHAVNEERARDGLAPVNSFWISGTGALPADARPAEPAGLRVAHDLRDAALSGDWAAWSRAWQELDAKECPRLAEAIERGQAVALSLCGDRGARTWASAGNGGVWRRLAAPFARKQAAALLESL